VEDGFDTLTVAKLASPPELTEVTVPEPETIELIWFCRLVSVVYIPVRLTGIPPVNVVYAVQTFDF
jgi:hypothetical protein